MSVLKKLFTVYSNKDKCNFKDCLMKWLYAVNYHDREVMNIQMMFLWKLYDKILNAIKLG